MSFAPLLLSVRIPSRLAILWRNHLAPGEKHRDKQTPRSVIIFRLDQLGDVVLTTPLFRELKRLYPKVHCTVVVQPQHREILSTNPNVDEILVLPALRSKWLPTRVRHLLGVLLLYRTELRHRRFDLAISPRWDVDEGLATMLCALTDAAKRVGYSSKEPAAKARLNQGFDSAFDLVVASGSPRHEVDRNLAIVEALGGVVENRNLDVRVTDRDRRFAGELLANHNSRRMLVAIGIGGRAAGRKWPLRNYAECIRRLNEQQPIQPVIVCSDDEDHEAMELSEMLPVSPYMLSGLPLRRVCAVLQRCHVFIGNDSGAAHLAAVGCAVVVVSRHPENGDPNHANSPVRFGPWCARSRVVQPLSGEGNCASACVSAQPHCILGVTVERVLEAVNELLPVEVATISRIEAHVGDGRQLVGVAGPA